MDEFLRINLGNILTIITFLTGGVYFVSTLKGTLEAHGDRLENVENGLDKLSTVVVSIARQEERLNAVDQRMTLQGKRLDLVTGQIIRRRKEIEDNGEI